MPDTYHPVRVTINGRTFVMSRGYRLNIHPPAEELFAGVLVDRPGYLGLVVIWREIMVGTIRVDSTGMGYAAVGEACHQVCLSVEAGAEALLRGYIQARLKKINAGDDWQLEEATNGRR